MAIKPEHANPSLEPSQLDVLRDKLKNQPEGDGEKLVFSHVQREMVSIEHPFFVKNIDQAVAQFGSHPEFENLFERGSDASTPFYFDLSPTARPIMSSHVGTNAHLLKVTIPKRSGRRRKKGTDGPWLDTPFREVQAESPDNPDTSQRPPFQFLAQPGDEEDEYEMDPYEQKAQKGRLYDQKSLMSPKRLVRMLRDNVGKYRLESIGNITHTHRFRELADFYWDMSKSRFMNNFLEKVYYGDINSMREFKLNPNPSDKPDADIIAPPMITNFGLPFQYFYEQNPYVRIHAADNSDGGMDLINVQAKKNFTSSFYIRHDHVGVPREEDMDPPPIIDPDLMMVVERLRYLLNERPIWTRRSLFNQLGNELPSWDIFKRAMQYVAYQFKSGPWHNAVIRWGVDPRTDPKYRNYQTVQFQLLRKGERPLKRRHRHLPQGFRQPRDREFEHRPIPMDDDSDSGDADLRPARGTKRYYHDGNPLSHMFDGVEYSSSGRVWQVCDITDPLLYNILRNSPVRPTCNIESSGWYHAGVWKKVKNIMRLKMIAIRFKRKVQDEDFQRVIHEYPDKTPPPDAKIPYFLLPNLGLTKEEMEELQGPNRWRRKMRIAPGRTVLESGGIKRVMPERKMDILLKDPGRASESCKPLENGKDETNLDSPSERTGTSTPIGDQEMLNQDKVLAGLSEEEDSSTSGSVSDFDDDYENGGESGQDGQVGFGFPIGHGYALSEDEEDEEAAYDYGGVEYVVEEGNDADEIDGYYPQAGPS